MSRESKILNANGNAQGVIQAYESFGWELLGLNGNQISMSRETQNPVYPELIKYQAQYEAKEAEIKALGQVKKPEEPDEFSFSTFFIALLFLIIPGLIYMIYKIVVWSSYKSEMEQYELECAELERKKNKIREEMNKIVADSRATFFSRQN